MAVDFAWDLRCLFLVVLLFVSCFVVQPWVCILYATLLFTTWRCRHSRNMSKGRFYDPAIQCYWVQEDSVTDVIARLSIFTKSNQTLEKK